MIDLSKIKPGDEVTVRAIVSRTERNAFPPNQWRLHWPNRPDCTLYAYPDDFASHTPKPQPLAVGDRVWGLMTKEGGEVLHAIGELYWVRFDDARHEVVFANQVERVS